MISPFDKLRASVLVILSLDQRPARPWLAARVSLSKHEPPMTPLLIAQIVLTLFVFIALLHSAAAMVWVERRLAALLQQRLGPIRVGWQGLLQPSPTSSS